MNSVNIAQKPATVFHSCCSVSSSSPRTQHCAATCHLLNKPSNLLGNKIPKLFIELQPLWWCGVRRLKIAATGSCLRPSFPRSEKEKFLYSSHPIAGWFKDFLHLETRIIVHCSRCQTATEHIL